VNKFILIKFIGCIFSTLLIGVGIIASDVDFPFAIFFLLPIAIYSIQKGTQTYQIIILAISAAGVWAISYCSTADISFGYMVLLHAFIRFAIYLSLSYLLMLLTKQRAELTIKNKELNDLNKEKNIILGIAAHDIRNSAGAIKGFSDILLERLKSKENLEKEIKISTIINSASENLLQLVTNLLDISKIESGEIHLNKILTDYNSFIESRIDLLQIIAQQKKISIAFHKNMDVKNVNFDPIYLTEVIDNLISNAIKYSNPNSEINVVIKIDDNWLRTEIVDSGIGIQSTEIDKLFKPFSKTSSRPTSGESSTGLGLAIAQKVVKLHGGEIGVKSKVNEGSTFYFTLPLSNSHIPD
jgi:signal transduction histidine kinase